MSELIIGLIVGGIISFIITYLVALYFSKRQSDEYRELNKKFDIAFEELIRMGKEKQIIIQEKPVPIPETPPQTQYPYDLSTGTSGVVGEGRTIKTSNPVIRDLFVYGTTKYGEAVIDSVIDSIFGEEVFECDRCGAKVDKNAKNCPSCGEDFEFS